MWFFLQWARFMFQWDQRGENVFAVGCIYLHVSMYHTFPVSISIWETSQGIQRKYYSSFKGSWSNRPQKILSPEVRMCIGVIADNLNSVFYSSTSFFFRPSHVCATCAAPTSTDSTPAFTVSSSPALPKNTSTSMPRAKDIISVWHAHTHSLPAGAAGAGFGVDAFVVQRVSQQTIRPVIRPLCLNGCAPNS